MEREKAYVITFDGVDDLHFSKMDLEEGEKLRPSDLVLESLQDGSAKTVAQIVKDTGLSSKAVRIAIVKLQRFSSIETASLATSIAPNTVVMADETLMSTLAARHGPETEEEYSDKGGRPYWQVGMPRSKAILEEIERSDMGTLRDIIDTGKTEPKDFSKYRGLPKFVEYLERSDEHKWTGKESNSRN